MTKDEALKLALEALQNPWKVGPDGVADAIIAIKEALAQPEQETLAWEQFYPDMGKPQLAPPHPWEKFCDSNCVWTDHHPDCKMAQRKPLTDEEILDKCESVPDYDIGNHDLIKFARAIEAKLRRKNDSMDT